MISAEPVAAYGLTFWEFRPLVLENGAIGCKLLQSLTRLLRTELSQTSWQ